MSTVDHPPTTEIAAGGVNHLTPYPPSVVTHNAYGKELSAQYELDKPLPSQARG